ncbi:MAG: polysaccharide biosynthesis protein [Clostridia bacterium]|nr:polysaccharide biosynthesis protein [Clostridia bacterium]
MGESLKPPAQGKTKSIIGGMTVLGLAGIICKLVGVLFSIPLQWMIDWDGLGVYNAVFPTYNLLLTVSSAGLPVAVSRLVARSLAKDDPRSARQVFRTALMLLTVLGCIATLIILGCSGLLAERVGIPASRLGFQVIAPCVALVCIMSAFRGLMQGQQNMTPTAISQLIEQVGKVAIALPLAWLGTVYGRDSGLSAAYGAAGALLGTTIAEAAALVYMLLLYLRSRTRLNSIPQLVSAQASSVSVLRQLLSISIPITIGACIVPLSQWIDSAMLMERLQQAGKAYNEAESLYGLFTGSVIRIINIPTALALAVSMSLVPAISSAKALGDQEMIVRQSDLGLRFAFLIGLPCSIGMSVLAEPIMRFFYENGSSVDTYLVTGGELLTVSSLTIVLFTVVQATTSILQGLGKQRIPMYTLVAGVVCKIILNYVLVGIDGIDIHGAPIASIVCYTVSLVPNLYYCMKYGRIRFNLMGWIVRPGIAAAAMGAAVWMLRELLPGGRFFTLLEVAVGVVVFAAAALAVKAITKDDLRAFRRRK